MTAGYLLQWAGPLMVPGSAPADIAVADNFERFNGLEPLANPASGPSPGGADYGWDQPGGSPRPGQSNTPLADQVYTSSPVHGLANTLGGQPLPVADPLHRPPGSYTGVTNNVGLPHRLGSGGRGPSELGAAQTVQLSEITSNPPEPGDLLSIIGGWGG